MPSLLTNLEPNFCLENVQQISKTFKPEPSKLLVQQQIFEIPFFTKTYFTQNLRGRKILVFPHCNVRSYEK